MVEDCFKRFDQSFNRIRYFLCIADNLTTETLPKSWDIKNSSGFAYKINKPEDDKKQYVVDGYKHFLHRYLVRDIIESFTVCLDKVLFVLLLNGKQILPSQKLIDVLSFQEKMKLIKFERRGLLDKVNLLEKNYSLTLTGRHKDVVESLTDIRNCLAHNSGKVREIDGQEDQNNMRKFFWITSLLYMEGIDSGREYPVEFNVPLPENSNLCFKFSDHIRSFKIGEDLDFSSIEAFEIAMSLRYVGVSYLDILRKKLFPAS